MGDSEPRAVDPIERRLEVAEAVAQSNQRAHRVAFQWGEQMERERDEARTEIDRLRDTVARVQALHQPQTREHITFDCPHRDSDEWPEVQHFDTCFEDYMTCSSDGTAWPCSTARALAGDPDETEDGHGQQ